MEAVVRSVYGAYLQTVQLMNLPFNLLAHTTLNEKFNILNSVAIPSNTTPSLQYFAIGNGGHKMVIGTGGITVPGPLQHNTTDAALYNQLPFVLRLPTNDLTPAQMANYRLRTTVIYNGVTYVAYYLKTINTNSSDGSLSINAPQILYNAVANGTVTTTPFVPSASNLNPTPPTTVTSGAVSTTGNYVSATAQIPISMSVFDVNEFLNVANIIYGDPSYAIISEIGLCSGLDYATSGIFNGTNQSYTDAIAVQIMSTIGTFYAVEFMNNGVNLVADVGAVEPLFALT